jgi:hypothetical protein
LFSMETIIDHPNFPRNQNQVVGWAVATSRCPGSGGLPGLPEMMDLPWDFPKILAQTCMRCV